MLGLPELVALGEDLVREQQLVMSSQLARDYYKNWGDKSDGPSLIGFRG